MIILSYVLSSISLLMTCLFFVRSPRPPFGFLVAVIKLTGQAFSLFWAAAGIVGAALGWAYEAPLAVAMGGIGAGMMIWYIRRCAREHKGFDRAFGLGWSDQISSEAKKRMVQKRWSWYLKMKASPEPSWQRDIAFWTIPGTDRQLLCDIWGPADGNTTGLVYIYLHGSAWAVGEKDFGTRSFFHHLAAQGHTVMDVSYRLLPETDIFGMVADAKRAVAWMKANADRFGVDPNKIILGGGSAGGHISLLAGYTPNNPELTPEDLNGDDISVRGLLTYYAPTDLVAGYESYGVKDFSEKQPAVPIGAKGDPKKPFPGRLDVLLGGHLDEVPDMYELACPFNHVHPGSPPTLLLQGNNDLLVPLKDAQILHAKLVESGVPAVMVDFPLTEHVFDLWFPQVSPAAQSALYDVDRFLALMAKKENNNE